MSYTEEIVRFVVEHKKELLPENVIEQAKLLTMDTLGCAIGGYCTEVGGKVVSKAKKYSGPKESSLIGDGGRVPSEFACWANSSLSNILDMDDVFLGTAHQGNCVVPTALAIGEKQKSSGLEVIHAIVLGFEVGSRIGLYVWPSPAKARTYFPSTWQVFNAVVVTGKLLGLGQEELYEAFGLAGTVPPLPTDMQKFVERPIGFGKNVFGWTTFTGVFWTLMAQEGVAGSHAILDGDAGFWTILGSDRHDFEKLVQGLGEKYNILDTKFKPYPVCTWGHTSLDATKKILEENEITAEDIDSVKVRTLNRAVDFLSNINMETIFDAQFSLPHAVSMLALRKTPGPEWMSEENMFHNPVAKAVAERVAMEVDPSAEQVFFEESGLAIPSTVEVRFDREELEDKFKSLASSVFTKKRIDKILENIYRLEDLEDVSVLVDLLKKD